MYKNKFSQKPGKARSTLEIKQFNYKRRKEISQMIQERSSSICKGITGCQVEMNGTGGELLKDYIGIVVSMHGSLFQHMPTEMSK